MLSSADESHALSDIEYASGGCRLWLRHPAGEEPRARDLAAQHRGDLLGLHRALLHNDALRTSETFRPYAEPGEWKGGTPGASGGVDPGCGARLTGPCRADLDSQVERSAISRRPRRWRSPQR